ncbi:MAG: 2-oxo acid dehydrogenase subunit E2 [Bdellovibrionales bacterium]|nr:2-oxo acid dehydrogenase subunit E2 [Bdellovibrionales bacterium]
MDLKLPELGEGVHEGELVKWKVKVGDMVKDDQVVCEIMTDKATVELPAPFSGKVTALNAKEGEVIHVGQVILNYDAGGASTSKSSSAPAASAASAPSKPAPSAPAPSMAAAPASGGGAFVASTGAAVMDSVMAAPSTRRFARESGVALNQVPASGPAGRVMREDVERFISGGGKGKSGVGATAAAAPVFARQTVLPVGTPTGDEHVAFKGLRKKISEKMRLSKDKAAHFTYVEEADATQLVALREAAKEIGAKQGIKVTYLPIVMKAMVAALRKYPILNSSLDEEKNEIIIKHYFNIGLSIQTDDGLTAPVVKNVEQKSILELAYEIQGLVDRARHKKLTLEDFQGGTITLTNAGSIGGLFATPVINYPEVAILGFNKIFRKPVVVNHGGREEVAIRDWTYFSISLDHRIVDGAVGAEFMKEFIRYIENPGLLVIS